MSVPTVTYADLVSRCLTYGYGISDEENFKAWLNRAYFDVAGMFPWDWLEAHTDIVTTPQQPTTPMPADLKQWGRLSPTTGVDNWYTPEYMSEFDYREYVRTRKYTENHYAQPAYYTLFANEIHWTPFPDREYTYRLSYWASPVALVDPSDVTRIPDYDVDVLVQYALSQMAQRENDYSKAASALDMAGAKVNQMMRNQKSRQKQKIDRVPMPASYGGVYDTDTRRRWRA